ncbi:MAG: hypothetical protein UY83_C0006G0081, partial [Candidatus Adlerbacteria bacterium GW2011_GWA1_54_10]
YEYRDERRYKAADRAGKVLEGLELLGGGDEREGKNKGGKK